jgi:hypothetical protein
LWWVKVDTLLKLLLFACAVVGVIVGIHDAVGVHDVVVIVVAIVTVIFLKK